MEGKLDLKREMKALYSPKADPAAVSVPALKSLAIDGEGDPNGGAGFQEAIEALYAAAYALKFAVKGAGGRDWAVMPPEGEWWCDKMDQFSLDRKGDWKWTLHIVQPDFVSREEAEAAVAAAAAKKGIAAISRVRFEISPACEAATLTHVGPYSAEAPNIARLHAFIADNGWKLSGRHREIYLGDPRKANPEKMKTVLRQPFER